MDIQLIIGKVKSIFTETELFFSDVEKEPGIKGALIFALIFLVINNIFSLFYYTSYLPFVLDVGSVPFINILGLVFLVFLPLQVAFIFGGAGLSYIFLKMVKGIGTYKETFKVMVYAATPSFLLGPVFMLYAAFVGPENTATLLISNIISIPIALYVLYLAMIGIAQVHKIDKWKAVLGAFILPYAALFLLSLLLALILPSILV